MSYHFGGFHKKDYSILGVYMGVPIFWEITVYVYMYMVDSIRLYRDTYGSLGLCWGMWGSGFAKSGACLLELR